MCSLCVCVCVCSCSHKCKHVCICTTLGAISQELSVLFSDGLRVASRPLRLSWLVKESLGLLLCLPTWSYRWGSTAGSLKWLLGIRSSWLGYLPSLLFSLEGMTHRLNFPFCLSYWSTTVRVGFYSLFFLVLLLVFHFICLFLVSCDSYVFL